MIATMLCCDFLLANVFVVADYIFDYLTILVAVGGYSLVSTFHQALKYTFKVMFVLECLRKHSVYVVQK